MKTLRTNAELEKKLAEAAKCSGKSESEIMREGIQAHCDMVLSNNNGDKEDHLRHWDEAINEVSAAVENLSPIMKKQWDDLHQRFPDGPASHVEEIFGEIVEEKQARIRRARSQRKAA